MSNTANNPNVSSISSVRVLFPHQHLDILLERGGYIKNDQLYSNDNIIILPYDDTLIMKVGGHSHIFLTRSAIEIFFDGRFRVTVKASFDWKGLFCGVCGDYNDNPLDDFKFLMEL